MPLSEDPYVLRCAIAMRDPMCVPSELRNRDAYCMHLPVFVKEDYYPCSSGLLIAFLIHLAGVRDLPRVVFSRDGVHPPEARLLHLPCLLQFLPPHDFKDAFRLIIRRLCSKFPQLRRRVVRILLFKCRRRRR